eukprot:3059664-Heterocapsa_arctica.AAC.1
MLDQHGLKHCKPVVSPGEPEQRDQTPDLDERMHRRFRSTVGCLMWVINERPDIASTVLSLARYAAYLTLAQWGRMKRLLRYLQ